MIQQIFNNFRPTRNLKEKCILQSKKIKPTTDQFETEITSAIFKFPDELKKWNWWNSKSEPVIDVVEQEMCIARKLIENIAPQKTKSTCMVCMIDTIENRMPHVIISCGHALICDIYFNSILPLKDRCPICRLKHYTFQRIFLN